MSRERADRLADAWESAWAGRDPAAFAEVCAPDVHYEDPLCARPLSGTEQLARHARRLWRAVPDAAIVPTGHRLADEAFLAAPFRLEGTHTGSLGEALPGTGRRVEVVGVCFCELTQDGARLLRVRAFFDAYALAVSLGVLPRPGTLAERAMLMVRGFGLRARS